LQVQYAFLELPKLGDRKPKTGAELWAWLFVHGPELKEVPPELPKGPHREAVELANEATFTKLELEAYRKVMDEIQQAREYGAAQRAEGREEGLVDGHKSGLAEGLTEGKRDTLLRLLKRAGIELSEADLARIRACKDVATLDKWTENIFGAKNSADVLG
jgi:flagellar biosynthesis/type III secretory pathway protein FliH